MARSLNTWSEVRKRDKTKVLYPVSTIAIEPVDTGDVFAIRDLLLFPFLCNVTRPVNDFILVLVCDFQTVDAIFT